MVRSCCAVGCTRRTKKFKIAFLGHRADARDVTTTTYSTSVWQSLKVLFPFISSGKTPAKIPKSWKSQTTTSKPQRSLLLQTSSRILDSVMTRSTELGDLTAWPWEDLAPLMAWIELRSREKARWQRSQHKVVLQGESHFCESIEAKHLQKDVALTPKPPATAMKSGVKEGCSTSRTCCSYARFFLPQVH